jgi:hypothetical protein
MIPLAEVQAMAAVMRAQHIPGRELVPGDGEPVYLLTLPEANAQSAFELGLAPFCPVPGADLPPYYPLAQVPA